MTATRTGRSSPRLIVVDVDAERDEPRRTMRRLQPVDCRELRQHPRRLPQNDSSDVAAVFRAGARWCRDGTQREVGRQLPESRCAGPRASNADGGARSAAASIRNFRAM